MNIINFAKFILNLIINKLFREFSFKSIFPRKLYLFYTSLKSLKWDRKMAVGEMST